ncbi:hypothetical protein POV27_12260 [Aureisphaera galaxeae]|uniref:hypothetical protein n=1 Tax=Aureisphaera galaxeae TaxID=1538023 RepID=UPI00235053CE|nr:hypothetical protein [Aureisphaera galaxeae]MDC8004828.1 hypothetical protein [Aureisphaera galaxeae]
MKKLFSIILILNSIISFSQTERDSLALDVANSIKAINASDYETLLKYFPDFVFDNISKEELLKDVSGGNIKSSIPEVTSIKIDTIIIINSTKYARFYIENEVPTYGIKTRKNANWTFIDLNEVTEKYIPIQIRPTVKDN